MRKDQVHMRDKKVIQEIFDNHFEQYKSQPIALYGTGNNAEMIIDNIKGYFINCVISLKDVGELFHGIKIVSLEEAIRTCKIIIIAAVPSSTSVIYNRICDMVPDDIKIYDMRGNLQKKDNVRNNPYWKNNKKLLQNKIRENDIISFDIFDTLIQRRVLGLEDIWNSVEEKIKINGINLSNFATLRRKAEKLARKKKPVPSINDIYDILRNETGLSKREVAYIRDIEYECDMENIQPRREMVEILKWAINEGKDIFFTSDMYYSAEQIKKLLDKCGIPTEIDLLISSEEGVDKVSGNIYKLLRERAKNKKILHIGDNYEYDFLNPQKYGIDSFWVMNKYDLLCHSTISRFVDYEKVLEKDILSRMTEHFFENPFDICKSYGKISINQYYDVALCILPITLKYMQFIIECAKEYDLLLFPSRDGFFIYNLYQWIKKEQKLNIADAKYFYTSRSGISSAVIYDTQTIETYCSKLWKDKDQNIKRFLKNQFQIDVGDEMNASLADALKKYSKEDIEREILKYDKQIIRKSAINRRNYQKYLSENNIMQYKKIAVVDIVTHGTLLKGISDLLKKDIDLIAMGTSAVPNEYIEDMSRVKSLYGNVNEESNHIFFPTSDLAELHLILEILYSSREGQFVCFTENSHPEFLEGSEYNEALLLHVQKSLYEMVKEYCVGDKFKLEISREFALDILSIFRASFSTISAFISQQFVFSDPYDEKKLHCNIMDTINTGISK